MITDKYDRYSIIAKLERKGLRAKHYRGTQTLSHFEAPYYVRLGIKLRGLLAFLKVPLIRKLYKSHRFGPGKPSYNINQDHTCSYSWFHTRKEAEDWVEVQKDNPKLGFSVGKTEILQTGRMEFRACVEGA